MSALYPSAYSARTPTVKVMRARYHSDGKEDKGMIAISCGARSASSYNAKKEG
jgi:hypothetical protein